MDIDLVERLCLTLLSQLKAAKGAIEELKKAEHAAQAEVSQMKEELQCQQKALNEALASLSSQPLVIDKSGEVAVLLSEATKLKATISSLQSKVYQQKRQLDSVLAEAEAIRRAANAH